jgi:8-oxo-dGTP diphosphatase
MKNYPAIKDAELAKKYGYSIPLKDFFTCAMSVDCVIFGYVEGEVKVLLIERGAEPFKGKWALPGDLMYPTEGLEVAAHRVLNSLTGIDNLFMEQAGSFGEVDRHPIGRVVTVSYYALVNIEDYSPKAHSWAEKLHWHPLKDIPELAFDHNIILNKAKNRLQESIETRHIGFNLLPEKFTLKDVQHIYELILEKQFDKANFRKKMLSSEVLVPLEELESNVNHRPAKLYKLSCPSLLENQMES